VQFKKNVHGINHKTVIMQQAKKIREADLKDVDTIFSFICHLEETSFGFQTFKDRFTKNLDDERCIYLVAVNDFDEVIGFISCQGQALLHHEGNVYEIQETYVSKNHRGKGIAKSLFTALEEKLAETGCKKLELCAHIKRADVRKFFTKKGFVQTHVKFEKEI